MKFALIPIWQIGRISTQKNTTVVDFADKSSKGDGKSTSTASKSIKRIIFGDKNHETRLVQCRPVDEKQEKREYRALLRKKIAERDRLQKVR